MTETANKLTQTTSGAVEIDALAHVLSALRVQGTVLLQDEYQGPWGISVPSEPDLQKMLRVPKDVRVIPFHLVRRGAFELRLGKKKPHLVREGELALVTSGLLHSLSEGEPIRYRPLADVMEQGPRAAQSRSGKSQASSHSPTSLICGAFSLQNAQHNPLARDLPPLLHIAAGGPNASFSARHVAQILMAEIEQPGGPRAWVVARLLELLFGEAVDGAIHGTPIAPRGSQAAPAALRVGWLKALSDPYVKKALDAFHRAPAEPWTVGKLAKVAALSPSRFAARFRERTGQSLMNYVTEWRLGLAHRFLRESGESIQVIGEQVGYDSVPAFSRAFKRQWGHAPSAVRLAQRDASF